MRGALVAMVDKGSQAEKGGVRTGDLVVAMNEEPLRDIIDYQMACLGDRLDVTIERDGRRLMLSLIHDGHEPLGITFQDAVFNGVRRCCNRCLFCFVDQMPAGVRPSLAIKDDDFRLSFLYGNFITLTNLTDLAIERIVQQMLSPLYISVHSVDADVRLRLLRPYGRDRGLENLNALLRAGVGIHAQIVLCPGVNDGPYLDETLDFLGTEEGVSSIGVVPVGLTTHRAGLPHLESFDAAGAELTIAQVKQWQRRFLKATGSRRVFLADEFYLLAKEDFPNAASYEGFPQLDNGIGLSRVFLDEVQRALNRGRPKLGVGRRLTALTAALAVPVLARAFDMVVARGGPEIDVAVVTNTFLGPEVTVAGLMAGRDVLREAARHQGQIVLPDVCLNEDHLFVDGLSFDEVNAGCGGRVTPVPSGGDAFMRFLGKAA